jgi:hypothetical protein
MKRIIWMTLLLLMLTSGASARFIYQEIDPVCSITWETFTVSAAGKSDTSTWEIPYVYEGECENTMSIDVQDKERIYKIMTTFFNKNKLYSDSQTWETFSGKALNERGRKYIKIYFFPAIQAYISNAKENNSADSLQVAIVNYAASTIWYDYYISRPE